MQNSEGEKKPNRNDLRALPLKAKKKRAIPLTVKIRLVVRIEGRVRSGLDRLGIREKETPIKDKG